jgi:hypothetical protein
MKLKDLLNRLSQWILIALVILFFLNLSIKLPFAPKGFEFIRSFPELHFLKELLVIMLLSLAVSFVSSKINKRFSFQLPNTLKKIDEKYFLVIIFLLSFLLNCLGAYFVFECIPHTPDEVSYLFQAKIFSTGRLYAQTPVSLYHFKYLFDVMKDGKWYSTYFPGFPLILALGVLIKIPWVINPIFGALSIVLIYLLGKELYSKKIAICASILGIFSPFFLFYNGTFLNETTSLFFVTSFILFFSKMFKRGNNGYPILSGLSLGMAFIIRPYTALFISLPFLGNLFYLFIKKDKDIFKKICLFSIGFMIFLIFLMWYNWKLTGEPLTLPVSQEDIIAGYYHKYDYPGFHRTPINTWGICGFNDWMHSPRRGLLNIDRNFVLLNRELFGWPVSLIFVFVPFFFIRKNKWDILLLFSFCSLVLGYFFYWLGWLKYWIPGLPALLFLTARGIFKAPLLLQKISIPKKTGRRFTSIFIIICFLYSLVFWFPYVIKSGKSWWCVNSKIFGAIRNNNIHNAIIFMVPEPRSNYNYYDYLKYQVKYMPEFNQTLLVSNNIFTVGFSKNSPDLQDDILYARGGEKNILLMKHYPNRSYFTYEYDFNTGTENLSEIPRQ